MLCIYASHASDVNTRKKHYWLHTFHDLRRSNFLAKPNTHICCSIKYGGEIHGCKCRDTRSPETLWQYLSKWVCVSIFPKNDYGSSRKSAHIKLGYTREEFARHAFNKGTIELVFVPTADQLANGYLKALPYHTILAISFKSYLYYYKKLLSTQIVITTILCHTISWVVI